MHERRGDEHACAEVSGEEERAVGHRQTREAADDDGEAAGGCADEEDEEESEDVQWGVVFAYPSIATAGRLFGGFFILSAAEFGVQEGEGDFCDF